MKLICSVLFSIFALAIFTNASAQATESMSVKAGQQKLAGKSKLKIKFVSVIEDSRCPVGANCVWAGNARVKVQIVGRQSSKTYEFNTGSGTHAGQYDMWSITLDSLTPQPATGATLDPKKYVAKFTIVRIQR